MVQLFLMYKQAVKFSFFAGLGGLSYDYGTCYLNYKGITDKYRTKERKTMYMLSSRNGEGSKEPSLLNKYILKRGLKDLLKVSTNTL